MQYAKINHDLFDIYVIFISDGMMPFNDSLVYYDVKIIKSNSASAEYYIGYEMTVSELDVAIVTDENEIHNLNKLMIFE